MWYRIPQLFMVSAQITHACYAQTANEEALLLDNQYDILISSEKLCHPTTALTEC